MVENKENLFMDNFEGVRSILSRISIFSALSDKQLNTLFPYLKKKSYKKNEYIFRKGDDPSHIFIIQRGAVKLVLNAETNSPLELVEFDVGACFGETSVLGIQSHSASAVAIEDTDLIVLQRSVLLSLFEKDLELFGILILNIAREACRRLHASDETLLHYVLKGK